MKTFFFCILLLVSSTSSGTINLPDKAPKGDYSKPLTNQNPCVFLAYEGFGYEPGLPLNQLSGGSGWQQPWNVQSNNTILPGYQTAQEPVSLIYADIQTSGTYAGGGYAYLTAGRKLLTSPEGSFADFVTQEVQQIGANTQGDTLWLSFLIRKNLNNQQHVYLELHNSDISWCNNCANLRAGFGYFGSESEIGGEKRWSLRINQTVYPTQIALTPGETAFVVAGFVFNDGQTNILLFVNPEISEGQTPVPDLVQQSTEGLLFRSLAAYMGSSPGNGNFDEIRFSDSFLCAIPVTDVLIDLPPVAVIVASPTEGQPPLDVSFDGSASYDPDNGPLVYSWDFGDGSPVSNLPVTTHSYTGFTGQLTATLTVEDPSGQISTAVQKITLFNEYNSFSCLPTITCLAKPTCTQHIGRIRLNLPSGVSATLTNDLGEIIAPQGWNEYMELAPGAYTVITSGINGCNDTIPLFLNIDSTKCDGWQPSLCEMKLGTNMDGFADWVPLRPMRNLLKHIREGLIPYTQDCNCWSIEGLTDEMTFDENGYPTHIPQATSQGNALVRFFLSSEGANLQSGQDYVLLYDGAGTIQLSGETQPVSVEPGRIVFSVTGSGNVWFQLLESQPGNHVKNIRLLRISDEFADLESNPFYEGFLQKIAPFELLRFMDWGHTNNNTLINWNNRKLPEHFSFAGNTGAPYEIMIQLCNQTQKAMWICVPHAADEDFIYQMATLFRDQLDPSLTIYLEYSNEVWNWIFEQAHYNIRHNPGNLMYGRAMAEKARKVFAIWHQVFAGQEYRVQRVLGLQGGFNYLNEHILGHLHPDEWDYGSPTHYIGLEHGEEGNPVLTASSTPENILQNARNHFLEFNHYVRQDYRNIQIYGKEVITYEGGQHFVGNVFGIPYDYQQAMWDAQYHPDIYHLYRELHDTIASWGCRLATNFSMASPQESVYGSWGVLNDIDIQPPFMETAPKYQALIDISCFDDTPNPPIQQQVSFSQGWSGISAYLEPENPDIPAMFNSLQSELTILYNFNGIYWPAGGLVTLNQWDNKSGYVVKLDSAADFVFSGYEPTEKSLSVNAGWNLIPVLYNQNINLEAWFANHLHKIILLKEVAGNAVYWPAMGIYSLLVLEPGKAYYLLASEGFVVDGMAD